MPPSPARDLESLLDAFESQCARGPVPLEDLDEFLPAPSDPRRSAHLVELLRVALERRWGAGDKRSIDAFRRSYPEVFADVTLLGPLAFEEYRLRVQDGQRVERDEYSRRYGVDVRRWPRIEAPASKSATAVDGADAKGEQERRWQSFSQRAPEVAKRWQEGAAAQPEVGQTWGDFELVAELGRGAFARVFLARQKSLAGRQVALKLTAGPTVEPAQLARLQHSHIVPIYSVHRQGDLTAVCMPYLGSSTLADVVRTSRPRSPDSLSAPRGGEAIVSTVVARLADLSTWREDREMAAPLELTTAESPSLREMGRSSYVDAVTRIMARTAEGLAHAHERGVLHRDLKPANILLGHDGEPLILDFNLAAADSDEAVGQALVGGTLPYMAPEQLDAVLDGRSTDRRADIFSMGVVFYELLVGRLPHPLPPGTFESLVEHLRRCWEAGPVGPRSVNPAVPRGLDAIVRKCLMLDPADRYQTAEDLAEDLRRQLDHQPLRHAREPWSWERVEKWNKRHPRLASASTVAIAASCVVLTISTAWYARGRQLAQARAEERYHEFERRLPQVRVKLAPGVRQAEPAIADDGVAAAEELLAAYGFATGDAGREDESVRLLSSEQRASLTRQSDELRALVAAAQPISLAPRRATAPGAEKELGVEKEPSDDLRGGALQAAWGMVRERRFGEAIELLDEHLRGEPRDAAAWLALGYCHVSRRDFARAEIAYTMCHSLAPELYVPHYFRGIVRLERKEFKSAREDFSDTLGLRPNLAEAYFHRALASQGLGDHASAIEDFARALELGMRHTRIYFLRSRSYAALGDDAAARSDLEQGLKVDPTDDQSWVARGLARMPTDAEGAERDFRAALDYNPASLPALGNLAHVLSERLQRPDEAEEYLARWIEQYPDDAVARGSRGVLRARRGKFAEATADADDALLRSTAPFVLYQTGCIQALAVRAGGEAGEASRAKARTLLARALRDQPGLHVEMRGDADLRELRDDAVFLRLLDAARTLVEGASK